MKKKILYTDFEDTASIIQKMLTSKELKKAVTRNNMYKFWDKVVGKKFSDKSKPYSMMGNVLIVACQNSSVVQELLLRKPQILEALKPYLKSLHINVNDLKFDCKKWVSEE